MSEPLIEKNPIILAFMQKHKPVPYSRMLFREDVFAEAQAYNKALIECAEIVQNAPTIAPEHPHWVSVEERKPPEYTDVWCAVYVTDLIYVEDGETVEEAIENRQREAARNPRVTLGSYSEDEGWTDGYFGMPMVCQPDYWLEMTIPEPPKEDA